MDVDLIFGITLPTVSQIKVMVTDMSFACHFLWALIKLIMYANWIARIESAISCHSKKPI